MPSLPIQCFEAKCLYSEASLQAVAINAASRAGDGHRWAKRHIEYEDPIVSSLLNFEPHLAAFLPETYALIKSSNRTVHPSVSRVILHGSRGLAGGYRPESDMDLSLIVDAPQGPDIERELQEILETTLDHWQAVIEPDLAVIFDIGDCELKCFEQAAWDEQICKSRGVNCFGLDKTQKGFHGLVSNASVQVKLMYPCLKIWQRI